MLFSHSSTEAVAATPASTETFYYTHPPITNAYTATEIPDKTKFAIIELSGSQVKVVPGDKVTTHKLRPVKDAGEKIEIGEVKALRDRLVVL